MPVISAKDSSYVLFPTANAADAFPMFVAMSAELTAVLFDFILL